MTWFKTCDDFPDNRKTRSLHRGPCRGDCVALWLFAGCWSSKNLEDGFVPDDVVPSFGFHLEAPSELVRVGLWEKSEKSGQTGYRFHDWSDYQPSSERVEAKRRAGAERKAKSRARLSSAKNEPTENSDVGLGLARGIAESDDASRMPRACLAHASRERERVSDLCSENSSSEISERAREALATPESLPACEVSNVTKLDIKFTLAQRGALRFRAVNADRLHATAGVDKHVDAALEAIASYPDSEWESATRVLQAEISAGKIRFLTPKGIVNNWQLYRIGQAPGGSSHCAKPPAKRSGPAAVSSREAIMLDAAGGGAEF